jgi:SAM-dependent methyltransferase
MIDWGVGHYEHTALELEPVAVHVVALADPKRGERGLDLATGTGNAALIAARAGASVTGLDAAERLIDVARQRAADAGLEADFLVGDVQSLPFDDGSFDVVLSVFGLIFAADAEAAFGELIRVLQPDGRAVIAVWLPAGPIDAVAGIFGRAVAEATGATPTRFAWHDNETLQALARRHGAKARFHPGDLSIEAESPEAYLAANEEHPMSVAGRPILERAGTADATLAQALAVLRDANEDPSGFRVTSPYRLIEITRETN